LFTKNQKSTNGQIARWAEKLRLQRYRYKNNTNIAPCILSFTQFSTNRESVSIRGGNFA
jgi:hypothetical protein